MAVLRLCTAKPENCTLGKKLTPPFLPAVKYKEGGVHKGAQMLHPLGGLLGCKAGKSISWVGRVHPTLTSGQFKCSYGQTCTQLCTDGSSAE